MSEKHNENLRELERGLKSGEGVFQGGVREGEASGDLFWVRFVYAFG